MGLEATTTGITIRCQKARNVLIFLRPPMNSLEDRQRGSPHGYLTNFGIFQRNCVTSRAGFTMLAAPSPPALRPVAPAAYPPEWWPQTDWGPDGNNRVSEHERAKPVHFPQQRDASSWSRLRSRTATRPSRVSGGSQDSVAQQRRADTAFSKKFSLEKNVGMIAALPGARAASLFTIYCFFS